MQLKLPLFPVNTTLVSDCLGVYEKEGLVQYIVNGLPVYAHPKGDLNAFRYIISNFIHQGLCRKTEVQRCFHVSEDSVQRAYKKFLKQGEAGFFGDDARKGKAHKITGDKREAIQKKLDKGQSVNSIAKQEGVRESAIRYGIAQGYLKKKVNPQPSGANEAGSTPNHRNEADQSAPLGIGTTRYEDRIAAATQGGGHAAVKFETSQSVCGAGVLFLLPALLSQGLLKTNEVYQMPKTHYYGLESVVLTLAFMALARIKNPEQLKQCKPGEIGRIIGLDRIPEVSCLREKIKILSDQKQAQKLNRLLIDEWYSPSSQEDLFLYIDGHVRIYYGCKARLPSKFVSRQKLCLSATTEYWVNDAQGQPVMMVMGELTEKLQTAIEDLIIPQLQQTVLLPCAPSSEEAKEIKTQEQPVLTDSSEIEKQPKRPVCTLIFDREAYQPSFFLRLWISWQIAIITYRKNVKDIWEPECFTSTEVTVLEQKVTMRLCERKVTLDGIVFREIRCLKEDGHQTSVITNNFIISMAVVAGRMFGRWVQENFFRYLIMDYDFDKMIEFGTETIDQNKEVVNPLYRKLNNQLKRERAKTQRLKAQQYALAEQSIDASLEDIAALTQKQMQLMEKIEQHQLKEQQIKDQRSKTTARIKLKDMANQERFNKLKPESKMLMNIIKMICYRAESTVANLLTEFLIRHKEEKRMLVKQIIQTSADLIADDQNKTLTVTLHSLSAPRFNEAAENLAQLLTEAESIFPGTDLRIIFKTTATKTAKGKEF